MDKIPPTLEERLDERLKCRAYFDNYYSCRSSSTQFASVYETGTVADCTEQWEEFKWCMRGKFFNDKESAQRLIMRKRRVYFDLDKLPWIYRKSYLEYLDDQKRLPKRLKYLTEEDDK
jgi:hypothetical protein